MPSFAGRLKPEEVDAIHQYLIKRGHDLQDELKAADAAKSGEADEDGGEDARSYSAPSNSLSS